ncbi:unnamed protein product [Dovyalis caffra]|uniref:Uncharacterized protein n=1 Tax=Dovyalis caffra TaxID=77055 RepID=A0AAV1RER5_9ROSI|nr:unnamed protein product [Dovyalis caffra]
MRNFEVVLVSRVVARDARYMSGAISGLGVDGVGYWWLELRGCYKEFIGEGKDLMVVERRNGRYGEELCMRRSSVVGAAYELELLFAHEKEGFIGAIIHTRKRRGLRGQLVWMVIEFVLYGA